VANGATLTPTGALIAGREAPDPTFDMR
jgi:hypothetical protein